MVENNLSKRIKYEDLIDEFILKNVRRKTFFKLKTLSCIKYYL